MKILALARDVPGTAAEEFNPHLEAEALGVWELFKSGVVREIYFRQNSPDAVLVLECEGEPQAKRVLGNLPLVKKGLIEFEYIGLIPYPGFERLFKEIRD